MVRNKKTRTTADKKPDGSREGTGSGAAAKEKPRDDSSSSAGTETLAGRADQLGAILAKGLDLAEAGLSLGLTVIQRVGTVAQESVVDRMPGGKPGQPQAAEPGTEAGQGFQQWTPQSESAGTVAPEESGFCITNRLPVAPGGSASISFSINNDSVAAPKRVSLAIKGFVGETGASQLEADGFVVKPQRKTIAPMDFEKFVLQGSIPPQTPPDVYRGWIVVSSVDEFSIPVRLVVMSP